MIAVIADDFTGAAEIGGIGLRNGLNVSIETEPIRSPGADLLVIATDMRSMRADEAAEMTAGIAERLLKLDPSFIFKKMDSVLRGNITEELIAQMKATGKERAIIIAANPAFDRVIRNGVYYIGKEPLSETCFSSDPQYPISSSSVLEILTSYAGFPLASRKADQDLPDRGIIIGDVDCIDDLSRWADKMDEHTVLAGASGFFNALLRKQNLSFGKRKTNPPPFGEKALFVLGSAYPKDSGFLKKLGGCNSCVCDMPEEVYFNKDSDRSAFDRWVNETVAAVEEHKRVFVAITHSGSKEGARLSATLGDLISRVVEKTELNELLIEGGSATSMILKSLGIKKLRPVQEVEPGVIRMTVEGAHQFMLTTKPGSYMWPEGVWIASDVERLNNIA